MYEMDKTESNARLALLQILRQSMQLTRGETVLIVHDSLTHPICRPACDAALELGLGFIAVHYPVHLQRNFGAPLPVVYRKVCEEVQGVMTMLTEAPLCINFRIATIEMALECNCKVVHMPGIDLDMLAASTDIPYEQLATLVSTHKDMLSRGREVEILTKDSTNVPHQLKFLITGREGHADGGIVSPGEIINFPTGEAYIPPIEGSANGSMVINGSVPDGVLTDREIVLYFKGGVLIPKKTAGTAEAQMSELLRSLESTARLDQGNSYHLAEFGIGCNPGYRRLTGKQVVDEKVAGTVHIALGSNKIFGGTIKAHTHLDLITHPNAVLIDGENIDLPQRKSR